MADLVIPKLGESISEAVIGKWLKNVGETVGADEPVVDLETDKVSVALPAPAAGVLAEQRFAEGDTVRVGEVIGTITPGAVTGPGTSAGKAADKDDHKIAAAATLGSAVALSPAKLNDGPKVMGAPVEDMNPMPRAALAEAQAAD